jgi:hypothetical protein
MYQDFEKRLRKPFKTDSSVHSTPWARTLFLFACQFFIYQKLHE